MRNFISLDAELPNPQYFPDAGAPPVPNFTINYIDEEGGQDAMYKIGDIISTNGDSRSITRKSALVDYKNMVGRVTTVDKDSSGLTSVTADHALYSLYNADTFFPAYRVHNKDSWDNFINHFLPASVGVFETSGYSGDYINYDPENLSDYMYQQRRSYSYISSSGGLEKVSDGVQMWGRVSYPFGRYDLESMGESYAAGQYRVEALFTVEGGSATVRIGNAYPSSNSPWIAVTPTSESSYAAGTHRVSTFLGGSVGSPFCPGFSAVTSSSNIKVTLHSLTIFTRPDNAPLVSGGVGKYGYPVLYTRQAPRARHDNSFAVIGDKHTFLSEVARPPEGTTVYIPSAVSDESSLLFKSLDFTLSVSDVRRTLAADPAAITVKAANNVFIFRLGRHSSDSTKAILELRYKNEDTGTDTYIFNTILGINDFIDSTQKEFTVTMRYDSVANIWQLFVLGTKGGDFFVGEMADTTAAAVDLSNVFKIENVEHSGNTGKYTSLQITGYTASVKNTSVDYTAAGYFPKFSDTFFASAPTKYPYYIPAQSGNLWQILNNLNAIMSFDLKVI